MFARLKRTNASARKYSNCCAVHSAVYIEPREASRGGREQNFPLTNAAGLCRAAGELPARETIRRKKEMERESNYPSAKTDTSRDAGLNPDVGSEVCVDWSYGGAGKRAPGGPLWDGRWFSAYHGEPGKTRSHIAVFAGDAAPCLAPRGSTLQLGTAVSFLGGGGLWAELCRCKGRRVNAWHSLSRLVSVKWAGGASPGMREGIVEVPACLCHLKERAQGPCFMLLQRDCAGAADNRERGWETGAWGSERWMETCRRPPRKEEVPLPPGHGKQQSVWP